MKLSLSDRTIDVFTISPRTTDTDSYWKNIRDTMSLSEKYGYSGNLIFTGNDIFVDTWLVAHAIMAETSSLSPLVAVNPIYMHPFSAAKMISSFAYIFGRKTYVNCVTGTSKNDLLSFNDTLDHDDRYERLSEYIEIVKELLTGVPVSYCGKFYTINDLQLQPEMPKELMPEFYIAGASEAARKVAQRIGAIHMVMGKPFTHAAGSSFSALKNEGVYLGIVTRATARDAWERVNSLFPESEEGKMMLEYSMSNTDSQWKHELKRFADSENIKDERFWMRPFKGFQADCPYYVGDYEQIAELISAYLMSGIRSIILDTPSDESDYFHLQKAFLKVNEMLSGTAANTENDFPEITFRFK